MFHRISDAAAALPARVEPTSLLKLLAGEFALRVARLWPAPHAPFLTASAARRHLVCLSLAFGRDVGPDRDLLLAGRLRRAIPLALAQAPPGLERALGRMGEAAWPAADYRGLVRLLGCPKAAKVVRHAEALDAETVRRLVALPPGMGEAVHLALALRPEGVAAIREAYEAIRFRHGAAAAEAAAARWGRAGSAKALFEAARDDLTPEPAPPPFPGTARLRPLATKAELRATARRLRNCLAERAPYAATGWSAYYLWEGPPTAIVEITRDHMFGWRLDESRAAGNAPVPGPARDEIVSELALMGVHVGRSGWELERLLRDDAGEAFALRPVERVVAEAFGAG